MKESDAVIFLLSVDSPINQIEIDFLKSTRDFAAKFYFAVNKIDSVSREELSVYLEYCKTVLGQITGETAEMFPVSTKTGEKVEKLLFLLFIARTRALHATEAGCQTLQRLV